MKIEEGFLLFKSDDFCGFFSRIRPPLHHKTEMYPVYHLLMAGVIWGYISYDHAAFESEQYDSKRPKVVLITKFLKKISTVMSVLV